MKNLFDNLFENPLYYSPTHIIANLITHKRTFYMCSITLSLNSSISLKRKRNNSPSHRLTKQITNVLLDRFEAKVTRSVKNQITKKNPSENLAT